MIRSIIAVAQNANVDMEYRLIRVSTFTGSAA